MYSGDSASISTIPLVFVQPEHLLPPPGKNALSHHSYLKVVMLCDVLPDHSGKVDENDSATKVPGKGPFAPVICCRSIQSSLAVDVSSFLALVKASIQARALS